MSSEVPNASVTVTNNSDLNDSREINFEYLKHVVLKFMSCRESEVKTYAYCLFLSLSVSGDSRLLPAKGISMPVLCFYT